ncbi:MAG: sulfite exporter TauE/SafE family protein [Planctomycetes bacterium]|nr:sulfite exporter TauE/SafE family protein [Planctomycetota bacterium]
MPADTLAILAVLFLIVGALYASVGHAGASGYLAVMALVGVEAAVMRPTALSINVLVAVIAFTQFACAGHFSWTLFWPFAVASIPAAYVGGLVQLPQQALKAAIGVVLVLTAVRMAFVAWRPPKAASAPRPPSMPVALAVGSGLGFLAGLTGTGGGIFLSPVILLMGWADPKRTAATSSLFILVNSFAGLGGLASRVDPTHLAVAARGVRGGRRHHRGDTRQPASDTSHSQCPARGRPAHRRREAGGLVKAAISTPASSKSARLA